MLWTIWINNNISLNSNVFLLNQSADEIMATFHNTCGVPQGSLLDPKPFSLWMFPIIQNQLSWMLLCKYYTTESTYETKLHCWAIFGRRLLTWMAECFRHFCIRYCWHDACTYRINIDLSFWTSMSLMGKQFNYLNNQLIIWWGMFPNGQQEKNYTNIPIRYIWAIVNHYLTSKPCKRYVETLEYKAYAKFIEAHYLSACWKKLECSPETISDCNDLNFAVRWGDVDLLTCRDSRSRGRSRLDHHHIFIQSTWTHRLNLVYYWNTPYRWMKAKKGYNYNTINRIHTLQMKTFSMNSWFWLLFIWIRHVFRTFLHWSWLNNWMSTNKPVCPFVIFHCKQTTDKHMKVCACCQLYSTLYLLLFSKKVLLLFFLKGCV